MEKEYDVAVVGASIAGCTAATLFARRGASVALIERHSDPNAHKVLCTHFIQPSAVPTIERERPGTTKNAGSEASERLSVRSALSSGAILRMLLAARRFKRLDHGAGRLKQRP